MRRSAIGFGFSPRRSSAARMNRSIGRADPAGVCARRAARPAPADGTTRNPCRPGSDRRLTGRRRGPVDERPVVGGAQIDPAGDIGDRRVGKLRRLLGHVRLVCMPDQGGQPALLAAAFEHAAIDQRLAVREVEPPFLRLAAVAVEAMLHQRGPHPGLEEGEPLFHFRAWSAGTLGVSSARNRGTNGTRAKTMTVRPGRVRMFMVGVFRSRLNGGVTRFRLFHDTAPGVRPAIVPRRHRM